MQNSSSAPAAQAPSVPVRIPCVIIAFSEPPEKFHFLLSKSKKTWWRKADDVAIAQQIGKALAAIGVHGRIKRPQARAIVQVVHAIKRKNNRARASAPKRIAEEARQEARRIATEQQRRANDIARRFAR